METREFSFDPVTGLRRVWHYDQTNDQATIETIQPVDDLVEVNKFLANSTDERANWKGELHRVASIPLSIYFDLKKQGVLDDQDALRKWLNERDNRVFRTRPGRV